MMNIQEIVESSWDKDEFLTTEQRDWLVENFQMKEFEEAYFEDLVETYQGSCRSLEIKDQDFLEEFELFQALDDEIFECAFCGWWFECGEQGDYEQEMICESCHEEANGEEEEEEEEPPRRRRR